MRKYQYFITRTVVLLFLLSASVSAWTATVVASNTTADKHHCPEQMAQSEHADHHGSHHQPVSESQHDCCKKSNSCKKLCCNFCTVSGITSLALLSFTNLQIGFQVAEFTPNAVSLPDGILSSTPYRPPQALLI